MKEALVAYSQRIKEAVDCGFIEEPKNLQRDLEKHLEKHLVYTNTKPF